MASMRNLIMAFLDRSARTPFAWGQSDCMLEIADWIDFACKLRVAARWRGRYDSEDSLDQLLAPLGGFEQAMRGEAATLGLAEVAQPEVGDIALVTLAGQDRPLGAMLMPSGRWRLRTQTGVVVTRAVEVIVAWGLPCRSS